MKYLHVIVIHAKHLTYRRKFMLSTLNIIQDMCVKKSYTYDLHFVHEHELADIRNNIKDVENKLEKYTGQDTDFNTNAFTTEQVSNFYKHRNAIHKITQLHKLENENDKHYYMIIEDDCTIIPEFIQNLEIFLEKPDIEPWDILFLCISDSNNTDAKYEFKDTRKLSKIIQSKDMYCVTPSCAKLMVPFFEKISFSYRMQLSYFIHTNPNLRAMYSTKRVTIEGSKIGLYPSSTNDNNIPLYNKDYIKLFHMLLGKEKLDFKKAKEYYSAAEHLEAPDIIHIYAVIMHKLNKHEEAKKLMEKSLDLMILKNGLITRRSELLNNAININSMCQENDVKKYQSNPSKYA